MPRGRGSVLSHINYSFQFPDTTEASGVWTLREVHEYTAKQQWPALAPYPPSAPNATAGENSVSLSWNNVWVTPSVVDYGIQYSSDGGATWTTFADGVSPDTTAVVTGLTAGVAYIFRLFAVNALGASAFGSASSTVTPFPPLTELIAFYKMDNLTDATGNGFTLTNNQGATFVAGKVGNCAVLNNKWMQSPAQQPATAVTMAAWVYLQEAPSSQGTILINSVTGSNWGGGGCGIDITPSRKASGGVVRGDPGQSSFFSGSTTVPLSQWFHMAYTYSVASGVQKVYYNGVLDGSQSLSIANFGGDRSNKFGINGNADGTYGVGNCRLDAVGIWSVELTATEIATLYNGGAGRETGIPRGTF